MCIVNIAVLALADAGTGTVGVKKFVSLRSSFACAKVNIGDNSSGADLIISDVITQANSGIALSVSL